MGMGSHEAHGRGTFHSALNCNILNKHCFWRDSCLCLAQHRGRVKGDKEKGGYRKGRFFSLIQNGFQIPEDFPSSDIGQRALTGSGVC